MKCKLFPVLHFQFIAASCRSVPLQRDSDRLGDTQTTMEFVFRDDLPYAQSVNQTYLLTALHPTAPAVSSPQSEITRGRLYCHLGADMFKAPGPEI